jgi:hypothetical protein
MGDKPLSGVKLVSVKGKTNATLTDYDGHYILSATSRDILDRFLLGYNNWFPLMQSRTTSNINLKEK